ncbi:amidohydrolase family protein [Microbacterium sp. SORGH_AS_0888]|uniref:amidohydrolase family protein n=1 Tax=Microbacterium sp. SORGH_AS_0888 TaxID=3041791 RepID=UPI00278644A5|nr:amidohydrolase family protein [Microbacterium sp. SORGH_AS_0888]MDQ1130310.1 4-oxalmesaconate hydratase [Microbacterium sp. SORGH_AS_0888]
MIIDCHGHFTTTPPGVAAWREAQLAADTAEAVAAVAAREYDVTDDELIEAVSGAQLAQQRERGTDLTIFSPRASWMGHHIGDADTSREWTRRQNDLVHRVCTLFPGKFAPVAQLPQSPGAGLRASVDELRRCVEELGFIGCNVNPDPTGGSWSGPALGDDYWTPLWDEMERLDVPGMVHVSTSALAAVHTTGAYYLAADTTAFMQALTSGFLARRESLRLILPHGGGAAPYHWGRFQGMAQDNGWDVEGTLSHLWFDTCVYHQPGIDLLLEVVPTSQILFGSEMIGAVRGVNPATGRHWDDTKTYIEAAVADLRARAEIFEGNARRVYPRLEAWLPAA